MLRLHFTSDDLSRIRFASRPDPLWETMLSIGLLSTVRGRAVFDPWRARARIGLAPLPREHWRLLRHLVPAKGDFPDFLTPSEASQGLEAGIAAILGTPRRRLRQEMTVLPHARSVTRPLREGDPAALRGLGEALRRYHAAVIAPYWPRIHAVVDAERAVRARTLLDHGSEELLAGLGPTMRWRPPVLETDYPAEHEIHLAGRGLLMVPSAFCWRTPVTLIDPGLPPVLVYPARRGPDWWHVTACGGAPRPLANLLGPTRAACLRVIEDGCTTGELARRIGGTSSTASQHATTLREAGLITSTRQGNTVIHTVTPLGAALLDAALGDDRPRRTVPTDRAANG
jgi:DNA-binding transcriptional ArsR family regulator